MLSNLPSDIDIYIAFGYTDMRRSIDGLVTLVQQSFQLNPYSNSIYLFCGRKSDRLKALLWEGDGFLLLYKRLEDGRFRWPRSKEEVLRISPQQYRWLLEGLSIEQPKAVRKIGIKKVV